MKGNCRSQGFAGWRHREEETPSVFSGVDNLALPHGLLDLFLKLQTFNTGLGRQGRQSKMGKAQEGPHGLEAS